VYRDYHAHTVNGMRAWANSGRPYDREIAHARAREHAAHFVTQVRRRAAAYSAARGRPALVVCALDTELLGHWWYEGPVWLDAVIEEAERQGLGLASLPRALERHEPRRAAIAASTWGTGKDLHTWDSPAVADLLWAARDAELRLVAALADGVDARDPAARRATRELLALQASDWAFMRSRGLAGDYPALRVRNHALAFREALSAVNRSMTDFAAVNGRSQPAEASSARSAPDERLRGLAPKLELSPLKAPASPHLGG
jgi:1,4-alpha-glucan branching enzyme